jgi:predicted secreted hydrolase
MRRYPLSAYRQVFPAGQEEAIMFLDPAEDGDHCQPEPNFTEWWYFDATFEDGSHLIAILHSNLFTIHTDLPTVDLRFYPPVGPSVVAIGHFDRASYSAASDRCRVKIGDCLAVDEGDRYRLSLRQEPLVAELTFWPQLPGWKAGSPHLFADSASGHYFNWVVPLPRARVEGTLTVAGQRRRVAGMGYHDHNWSNVNMSAIFDHWTWGRVMTSEWTLVFFDLVGHGKPPPRITPLMLARGDEILLATDRINVRGEEPMREHHTGAGYYHRLRLATVDELALELTLTVSRPIEAIDFSVPRWPLTSHPYLWKAADTVFYLTQGKPIVGRLAAWLLGKGSYLRWDADYRLDLSDYAAPEKGQTLYEVMLL